MAASPFSLAEDVTDTQMARTNTERHHSRQKLSGVMDTGPAECDATVLPTCTLTTRGVPLQCAPAPAELCAAHSLSDTIGSIPWL